MNDTMFTTTTAVAASSPAGSIVLDGIQAAGHFLGLGSTDPRMIAATLVRSGLGFLGIIFLIMILLAGFTFMTAGASSERAGAAKRTFFNAIIGLIIILSANSIVMYVIKAFNGVQDQPAIEAPNDPSISPSDL